MPHLRRRARIFVVDDEHLIDSTTALILSHYGFDAVFFTSPLDALLAARLDAPDLLVSDIVMPQISGILLAIRMQACCPGCRVLLFSGQWVRSSKLAHFAHLNWPTCTSPDVRIRGWTGGIRWNYLK